MSPAKSVVWIFSQDSGTPKQGWGDRHYFLSKSLAESGYEVVIFAANHCHMFTESVEFEGNYWIVQYDKVKYCWVKIPRYKKSKSRLRFFSWLIFAIKLFFIPKTKLSKPEIIIVSSMPMFPIIPALFYKIVWKAKVVFEVRDIWPLTVVELGEYSKYNPLIGMMKVLEKISYTYSDYLVSVLDNADKHFVKCVRKQLNFEWISNGISIELAQNNIEENHLSEIFQTNKFIVGYAGKMSTSNAVEYIIEAARLLTDNEGIHFILLGDGDQKESLLLRSEGLKNITYLPKIRKQNVHSVISRFDVAIISFHKLPIYKYGISTNKLFDYMMAGLPIIMASEYIHEAYYTSGAIIQVESESPQEIVRAVLNLSSMSKQERQIMGDAGNKYLNDNFLYEKLAKRYEKVFSELKSS